MRTVPDRCPFCESQIMVHGGNPLRSEDGLIANYECNTVQDVRWDEKYIRDGQTDACRIREVQLLTKQRDEARERIKRLEEAVETSIRAMEFYGPTSNIADSCKLLKLEMIKAKEAKP